jgi:O-antigen/teichoic acid export membrane protein
LNGVTSDSDGLRVADDRRAGLSPDRAEPGGIEPARSASREFPSAAPLSLRLNFSWIVVGNVVQALSRFGILVALTKLGTVEMTGRVVFGFAVCMPVFALGNLGLRSALVTDAKREYGFADYLRLRLFTTAVALAATCLIARLLFLFEYGTETAWIIAVIGVGKLFESLSDIFHGLLQKQERMDRVGMALMIRGPATLVLFALGMVSTGSPLWGIAGFSLGMAATFFLWDLPSGRLVCRAASGEVVDSSRCGLDWKDVLKAPVDGRALASLAWLTLPLGVVMLAMTLMVNLPRYFVQGMLGDAALGIFGSIGYLVMVGTMVVGAMGQSTIPRLSQYYAAGRRAAFCRLLGKLLVLVVCLGAAGVAVMALAGGPLLRFFYDQRIADDQVVAVYLMVHAAITYLNAPLGRAVDAMRKFRVHMMVRISGILLSLLLLPSFIRAGGLQGAAAAMILSTLAVTALFVLTILRGIRHIETGQEPCLSAAETPLPEIS